MGNLVCCRVCDSTNLELAIDLGNQPWCNHFLKAHEIGKEPFYPLKVLFCYECRTVQLDYTVKKEIMFGDHTYLSGITNSLSEHFRKITEEVDRRFFSDYQSKSVMDIGSNDGTQLEHFKRLGYEVVGVESSKTTAKIANNKGINTINEFFDSGLVEKLGKKFDVINAAGVFFHLEELHSVTEGIKRALEEDGVFIVQFLYIKKIVENLAFDQIYHEHLLYYSLETIETLLNRHGLTMFDAYLAAIHGGSIIGFVTHQGKKEPSQRLLKMRTEEEKDESNSFSYYLRFADRIDQMKEETVSYLRQKKKEGKTIWGFGAPVKGNTMLNYLQACILNLRIQIILQSYSFVQDLI